MKLFDKILKKDTQSDAINYHDKLLESKKAQYGFFDKLCKNLPEQKQLELLQNLLNAEKQAEHKANNKFTDEINMIDPYMHYNEFVSFMLHYGFDWYDINYYKDRLDELKQVMNNYALSERERNELVQNVYLRMYC